jgi:hypothetical protein
MPSDVFTASADDFIDETVDETQDKKKEEDKGPEFEIEIEDTTEQQRNTAAKNETTDYRFGDGDDVPEVLRGKSAAEVPGLIASMQQLTSRALAELQNRNQVQSQPVQDRGKDVDVSFSEDDFGVGADPEKFQEKLNQRLEQFAQQKMQPFVISQMVQSSQMAHQQAKSNLPYWELFGPQIEEYMGQQRVDVTSQYGNWAAVHDRLVTMNMPKVMEHEQKKRAKPEPGFSETRNTVQNGGDKGKKRVKISREQADIAAAMGVPVESIVPFLD